jgi:hypothetical protein
VFVALVGLAASVRLVTTTPNFGAVTAAALFAGFYFRNRSVALCVPLAALLISDQFLGGYDRTVMAGVYLAQCLPIAWRPLLRRNLSPLTVGGGAVTSSLTFFGLSNAAVWYAWYPHTADGIARCYSTAVPFLANSLASDLLFSAGFFGLYALAVQFRSEPVPSISPEAA